MPLWLATALLILAAAGMALSRRYLQRNWVRTLCILFCGLLALACAVYIGLTVLFVDAVQNRPPVP